MRMENWAIVSDPYQAPEISGQYLRGNIYNSVNPRHEDGDGITTSRIVGKTSDNKVITKSGSVYELGVVLPDYEQHFPNARDRLLNTLPNLR